MTLPRGGPSAQQTRPPHCRALRWSWSRLRPRGCSGP
jgi:hypothetical protein